MGLLSYVFCCHNIFIFILFKDKTNKLPFSAPLWRWRGTSLSISQLQRLPKVYIFLNTRNTFNTELEYLRKLWECVMMCSVQYAMQMEIKSVPVYSHRAMAEIWNYGFDWYVKRLKLICTKVDDNMYKGWRRNWTHRDHGVLRRQSHQVRKPAVSHTFDKKTKTNKQAPVLENIQVEGLNISVSVSPCQTDLLLGQRCKSGCQKNPPHVNCPGTWRSTRCRTASGWWSSSGWKRGRRRKPRRLTCKTEFSTEMSAIYVHKHSM